MAARASSMTPNISMDWSFPLLSLRMVLIEEKEGKKDNTVKKRKEARVRIPYFHSNVTQGENASRH